MSRTSVALGLGHGTNYAFHALLEIAQAPQPLTAIEVADALGVPAPYMAKLLQRLAHAGLVKGRRGRKGGYSLGRDAHEMTLWDVALAVSEGWMRNSPSLDLPSCANCPLANRCPLKSVMLGLQGQVERAFKGITVGALLAQLTPRE